MLLQFWLGWNKLYLRLKYVSQKLSIYCKYIYTTTAAKHLKYQENFIPTKIGFTFYLTPT